MKIYRIKEKLLNKRNTEKRKNNKEGRKDGRRRKGVINYFKRINTVNELRK